VRKPRERRMSGVIREIRHHPVPATQHHIRQIMGYKRLDQRIRPRNESGRLAPLLTRLPRVKQGNT